MKFVMFAKSARRVLSALRALVLPVVLSGVVCAGPAAAQSADPVAQIDALVRQAEARGYLTPGLWSAYLQHREPVYEERDLRELLQLLQAGPADDCTQAVMLALYLDAHVRTTPDMIMDGTTMELVNIWIMPDEWNVLGGLAEAWSSKATVVLNPVDLARKMSLTLDAFVESHRQAVARNRALWVQEMVQHALSNGWTQATVERAQDHLRDKAAQNAAEIEDMLALTGQRREAAVAMRDAAHAAADRRYAGIRDSIIGPAADPSPFADYDRDEDDPRLSPYKNARDDAKAVADRLLVEELNKIDASRDREVGIDMLEIARARLQSRALSHYVVPIIEGRCAEIDKVMPLKDVAAQPRPKAPDLPAPDGGHWALVLQDGMTTFLDNNNCYEPRGSVGAGSAQFARSKPRCGDPWGAYTVRYTWSAPPPFLEPGQEVPLSATVVGDYGANWGNGGMMPYFGTEGESCAKGSRATVKIIKDRPDGFVGTAYNQAHQSSWSGLFKPPAGARFHDGRFQITYVLQPLGCYRYVYEWRE